MLLWKYYRPLFLALIFGASSMGMANPPDGKKLYTQHCAECHGKKGEGVEDEYSKPLIGDWPVGKLIHYVDKTMPDYDPDLVKGKEAEAISRFVFETFYQKPELFQKDSKIQLARLTNRQFRQSVSDLFAQFMGTPKIDDYKTGLKGKYYNAEGMNKKKKMHSERVDPKIAFVFGKKAPYQEMNPKKFSIYWEGSILPRESGWYEFFVQSPNGFALRINKLDGRPSIDEKVTAGVMREVGTKIFLLGGRPYPLRLDYHKFDDPNASIELSWRTPVGQKEIIPTEFLFTKMVNESYIPQQKLPPDDSSHGYERGIQVDQSWDEAITYAALDAAQFAAERINQLARTKNDDNQRKKKVMEIASRFVRYAFRQKLSEEDVNFFIKSRFNEQTPLHVSIEKIVLMTLKSPRFLYPEWQALEKKKADSYVVATRLALYMWDSIPDNHMHKQIDIGHFRNKGHIESQAKRMLQDPRSKAKFNDFMLHWLEMKNKELPSKNAQKYSTFTPTLALDLRRSLFRGIEKAIWEKNVNWHGFISMPSIQLNDRIANYYGLPFQTEANASGFISLESQKMGRVGLHTHPYILASHSYAEESSPIHRGVFVSRKILGRTLRPPKEAVSFRNADYDPNWTMRQKVTALTKPANCMSCHDLINATGFTLEGFDTTGRTRTNLGTNPLNIATEYLDENGNQIKLDGAQGLLQEALKSTRSSKYFIEELCKHLAKHPIQSYSDINFLELSKMLSSRKLTIKDLYLKIAMQAATDDFIFNN